MDMGGVKNVCMGVCGCDMCAWVYVDVICVHGCMWM